MQPTKATTFLAFALVGLATLFAKAATATELRLTAPLDYVVAQRDSANSAPIQVEGQCALAASAIFQSRAVVRGTHGHWERLDADIEGTKFKGTVRMPAGGWHQLEIRALLGNGEIARQTVAHIGVGEVFVVAGQSNAANHGAEKQHTQTGRVASFSGTHWQVCRDPQPGASGRGGSFLPPLGDALVETFDVPIGFLACGIGATSVREWLPEGTSFPAPPTIESRVRQRGDGTWESKGAAFKMLVKRMRALGPHGFRAVLWHQGESDANQKDASRTLPGTLYHKYLTQVIKQSRHEIAWSAPWFVAQVSYHVPGDEASPDIRAAQASLWEDQTALQGPDSDALKGTWRDRDGQGVHFSGPGLRAHAKEWHAQIAPWLREQLEREDH